MAKLTDKLQELGKQAPGPLGFGRPRAARKAPSILVIGETGRAGLKDRLANAADASLDAVLVHLGEQAQLQEDEVAALKAHLWGVGVKSVSDEQLTALADAGCDFLLVESRSAPAVVFREDDMSRAFPIHAGISEEDARPLEDLPIDFYVLDIDPIWWPLTVEHLIHLQATVSMVSKNILLKVNSCPSATDLPLIRDLPVDGLIVDLDTASKELLSEIRTAVDALAPRKPRSDRGTAALLPQTGHTNADDETYEDDDYGDDDE
ncbi:MAG: hypothetical protein FJ314_09085 [SAR202 cluster bacterium]|nr:hypothetical protein [SAR202 cluster bacterium]